MANTPNLISIAFWTYVIPMTATRAMRIGLGLFFVFVISIVVLYMSGFVPKEFIDTALIGLRHFLVMAGLPVAAVLLSEIPVRDGITHRTLLYPLLGPVPRVTLSIVRLLATGTILAIGFGVAAVPDTDNTQGRSWFFRAGTVCGYTRCVCLRCAVRDGAPFQSSRSHYRPGNTFSFRHTARQSPVLDP